VKHMLGHGDEDPDEAIYEQLLVVAAEVPVCMHQLLPYMDSIPKIDLDSLW